MCGFQGGRTKQGARVGENTDWEAMNMCETLFTPHSHVSYLANELRGRWKNTEFEKKEFDYEG